MKYYSEKLNKTFDTAEECKKAELDFDNAQLSKEMEEVSKDVEKKSKSKEKKELAKIAKDCASGAVFLMSLFSVIIGIMIYVPKILEFIKR